MISTQSIISNSKHYAELKTGEFELFDYSNANLAVDSKANTAILDKLREQDVPLLATGVACG